MTQDEKVLKKIAELSEIDFKSLEKKAVEKRIEWIVNKQKNVIRGNSVSPREAFDLFFFDYLGLSRGDIKVVAEDETCIEWLSYNYCDTLEACKSLGLESKKVCRKIYEKSTQAFFSALDSRLRFHRSYKEIRPNTEYCREWLKKIDFEYYMKIAVEEAKISKSEGNKGYGAVIVLDGEMISRAHDTASTENDPSLHAEVNAIRNAVKVTGDSNLCGAVLFSSCEPCPMCSSLAVWSNLTSIIYGASIEKTSKAGKSRIMVSSQEIIDKSSVLIEVIGGILENECMELYK
jgi:tRNA(Arg) A34 adenosine deaminase TadA